MPFINYPKPPKRPVVPEVRYCDICHKEIRTGARSAIFTKPGFTAANPQTGIAHQACYNREGR